MDRREDSSKRLPTRTASPAPRECSDATGTISLTGAIHRARVSPANFSTSTRRLTCSTWCTADSRTGPLLDSFAWCWRFGPARKTAHRCQLINARNHILHKSRHKKARSQERQKSESNGGVTTDAAELMVAGLGGAATAPTLTHHCQTFAFEFPACHLIFGTRSAGCVIRDIDTRRSSVVSVL